ELLRRPGLWVDPQRHRRRQCLEPVLVGRRSQQILISRHLRPLANRLIDPRLDRRGGVGSAGPGGRPPRTPPPPRAGGDAPPDPPAVLARGDDPPEPPAVLARVVGGG